MCHDTIFPQTLQLMLKTVTPTAVVRWLKAWTHTKDTGSLVSHDVSVPHTEDNTHPLSVTNIVEGNIYMTICLS